MRRCSLCVQSLAHRLWSAARLAVGLSRRCNAAGIARISPRFRIELCVCARRRPLSVWRLQMPGVNCRFRPSSVFNSVSLRRDSLLVAAPDDPRYKAAPLIWYVVARPSGTYTGAVREAHAAIVFDRDSKRFIDDAGTEALSPTRSVNDCFGSDRGIVLQFDGASIRKEDI